MCFVDAWCTEALKWISQFPCHRDLPHNNIWQGWSGLIKSVAGFSAGIIFCIKNTLQKVIEKFSSSLKAGIQKFTINLLARELNFCSRNRPPSHHPSLLPHHRPQDQELHPFPSPLPPSSPPTAGPGVAPSTSLQTSRPVPCLRYQSMKLINSS